MSTNTKFFPYMNPRKRLFSLTPPIIPDRPNRWMGRAIIGRYRPLTVKSYLTTLDKFINNNDIDILLMTERFAHYVGEKHIREIDKVKKVMHLFDPIRNDKLTGFMEQNDFDGIFYENPMWEKDMIYDSPVYKLVPWSVDTMVFRKYTDEPELDVISSGIMSKHYPGRYKLKKMLSDHPGINFEYMNYPILDCIIGRSERNYEYFRKYAKLLSSAKIMAFYNGIKRRTVAKYVEGLASGSLMMAPTPLGAETYHLVPGKNFVDINSDNLVEKIEYYLENDKEARKIAERGMEDAKKYLDVKISVNNIVKILGEIVYE